MKTLYLVRHAKSSWKEPELMDIERPLNKRGNRDAPAMARHLKQEISCPDIFICSSARRTVDTAKFFLKAFDLNQNQMVHEDELYHAYENNFQKVISRIDNRHDSVMLFAHNPGITDYVNKLTDSSIFNVPTCGVAGIALDIENWKEIASKEGHLLFYYYPKGIDN